MEVILDRNLFHNNEILNHSEQIIDAIASGKLTVIGNPVLIEETLPCCFNGNLETIKKQLEFIFSLSPTNTYFDVIEEIIKKELKSMNKNYKYWKSPTKKTSSRIKALKKLNNNHLNYIKKIHEQNIERKKWIKDISKNIRTTGMNTISNIKKEGIYKATRKEFVASIYFEMTEAYLKRFSPDCKYTAEDIIKNRDNFLYFLLFVKGICLNLYLTAYEHNIKPDPSGENDLAQVIYLRNADAIVSNEKKYLPYMVEHIYEGHKKCLNLQEFLQELKNLILNR